MVDEALGPEEVSRRIGMALRIANETLTEMQTFFRAVRNAADESVTPIKKGGRLPTPSHKYKLGLGYNHYMATSLGFLGVLRSDQVGGQLGTQDAGGPPDGETDDEEEDEEEGVEPDEAEDKRQIAIAPDTKFLAVRTLLCNPGRRAAEEEFLPRVVGAIWSRLERTKKKRPAPEKQFQVRTGELLRGLWWFRPGLEADASFSWQINKYKLTAHIVGARTKLLGEFRSDDDVEGFVEEVLGFAGGD